MPAAAGPVLTGAALCAWMLGCLPLGCLLQIDADPDYDIMASLGSRPQLRGTRRVAPVPPREEVEAEIDASKEMLMEEHSMVSMAIAGRQRGACRGLSLAATAEPPNAEQGLRWGLRRAGPGRAAGKRCCSTQRRAHHSCTVPLTRTAPPCTAVPQTEEEFEAAKQATVQQMMAAAHQAAAPVLPNHLSQERRLMALVDKALPRDHPHYAAAKQRIAVLQVGEASRRAGCWGAGAGRRRPSPPLPRACGCWGLRSD